MRNAATKADGGNAGRWKAWKTIKPFPTLPTDLGNRSNRFPHSHRHDDYDEMNLISKLTDLRDTHSEGKFKDQTYAIAMKDNGLFAFAGVWERWKDRTKGEVLETYSIVTADPNELISNLSIHDRMPVILKPSDYGRWLEPGDLECPPVDLLRPFEADFMTVWKVGPDVGNVKNDSPDLAEPMNNTQSGLLF